MVFFLDGTRLSRGAKGEDLLTEFIVVNGDESTRICCNKPITREVPEQLVDEYKKVESLAVL